MHARATAACSMTAGQPMVAGLEEGSACQPKQHRTTEREEDMQHWRRWRSTCCGCSPRWHDLFCSRFPTLCCSGDHARVLGEEESKILPRITRMAETMDGTRPAHVATARS